MSDEKLIQITVMVSDKADIDRVATDLEKKGFVLSEKLSQIRVLTGRATAAAMSDLSTVADILAIEQDQINHTSAITPITEAIKLYASADKVGARERWDMPFPMGVFGTLREGHGNNRLMHRAKIEMHVRGFVPHFLAHGLSVGFNKGSTAPFEVFFYRPEEWAKMIPSVDNLEGFRPDYADQYQWGYYRTLAYVHLLPASFTHELFPSKGLSGSRDLCLPEAEWGKYQRIPCWIYSNKSANKEAKEAGVDTVIWG